MEGKCELCKSEFEVIFALFFGNDSFLSYCPNCGGKLVKNTITIKFGQGTEEGWRDMEELEKILSDKGYGTEFHRDRGTVKFTKKTEGEISEPVSAAMNKTKEGTFKRMLIEANYPSELIKDWTEEKCEAELGAIERANK